jgi:DNA-binding response OmpR family regulator
MNILIIEDDPKSIEFISIIFRIVLPGSKTEYACNKTDALKSLQEKDYVVITLDGQLEDNDHGRDILKELTPEQLQKIVVYSNDEHFLIECSKNNIKFIDKSRELASELRNILTSRGII